MHLGKMVQSQWLFCRHTSMPYCFEWMDTNKLNHTQVTLKHLDLCFNDEQKSHGFEMT